METFPSLLRRCGAFIGTLALLNLLPGLSCWQIRAEDNPPNSATNNVDGDKAWKGVLKATTPPAPPAEWQTHEPNEAEVAKFYIPALVQGADKAKDFYTKFPTHPKAADAHKTEYELLSLAAQRFGDTNNTARLESLEKVRLKDPKLGEDERLQMRLASLQKLFRGMPETTGELEKEARALQKDFPKHKEGYQVLMMLASNGTPEKGKAIAKEIMDNESAPEESKEEAKGLLNRLDAVGKPVNIKFTALDGTEVDATKMKGKVVLIDFWATWCGPCVAEIPHVKEAYDKLHGKGFEIIGISFDEEKDALEKFVAKKEMSWPQYFDGKGWQNKYGQAFGIRGIPTMWLVDKKGNLRDVNARGGLEEKVTKLLAE
ncbi:MAG: Alkyl hydroperoxide reductase/ Thiol specific antioxidant/ Mal allergen [Pedosphaera sp.]|nr:Alkyl hydroperoxide reductase/ Thiol specific antioxidant/ Mal allergen [Pedosphaera sp.]